MFGRGIIIGGGKVRRRVDHGKFCGRGCWPGAGTEAGALEPKPGGSIGPGGTLEGGAEALAL